MSVTYPAVTVSGGILTGGLLHRIGEADTGLPHTTAESYGRGPGESVRRLANRSYAYLKEIWHEYGKYRQRGGDTLSARHTRDRWLLVLLRELGYDGIEALSGGVTVDDKHFPISHRWQSTPVHLLGWAVPLDQRSAGVRGAAGAAPHSLVQQLLNRSDQYLWAVLSNGQRLRLLRDSTSLVGTAYLEFDLEAIFDADLFPDFVLLYRLAHASRLAVRDPETGPTSCVLEAWRGVGAADGERALAQLRAGVEQALEILGTGFLDHPANIHLRDRIANGLSEMDFQRSLLRLVYRLLFWFVAEDRGVLLEPAAEPLARHRYLEYFSSGRLRDLAVRRRHNRHGDLWQQVRLVLDTLGNGGLTQLALPALGGLFQPGPLDNPLDNIELTNSALLQAVEALAVLPATAARPRQRVDFRHLDAEELGSVYEGLLEVRPRWDPAARRYHLERLAGNERKTTGSYYTPSSLVECLLDSALDPLLDEATGHRTQEERIAALLDLTVCDPACGSGHFLIAAARRIAKRLAAEETDEPEPTPEALRAATRRVIGRCIYGVDVNDMAAELAKVSLWLEAMEPGKPLGYLDANIRVGNSLLGVTPSLLAGGIPDTAYAVLEGDDRRVVAALKRQNAEERSGQGDLFGPAGVHIGNVALARAADEIAHMEVGSLADVHVQAKRAEALDAERRRARLVADAWCAAFVQTKTEAARTSAITQAVLERLDHGEDTLDLIPVVEAVEHLSARYRFFHWHLEFPHIFRVPDVGLGEERAGWDGGFALAIGNPPWERVKLQEQEFFAARDPQVAAAANAAARKRAIAALAKSDNPARRVLHQEWLDAIRGSDGTSHLLRSTGRFPLTGRGDLNTYAVFAETVRTILGPCGQAGMILPTGIATEVTSQHYFKDLIVGGSLVSIYDFENEEKIFPNVTNRVRFALVTLSGHRRRSSIVSLAFRVRRAEQIAGRTYAITPEEIALLNPNTGTCPVFDFRRDAEITIDIYRRVPVLWRDGDPNGNPWQLIFLRMFDMATDSGVFYTAEQLDAAGWRVKKDVYIRGGGRMLPLYEGKMAHLFDHRFATYEGATQEQLNKGTLPQFNVAAHNDPAKLPMPRYWVDQDTVDVRLGGRWGLGWLVGWRDVTKSNQERTLIPAVLPRAAVGHTFPIAIFAHFPGALLGNMSAFVLDYVLRQKMSGTHVSYTYLKQLPVLPPDQYLEPTSWLSTVRLNEWVTPRVMELSYTAYDLEAYARDLGADGPPFRWVPERREMMRAELDAAYFHLYGVERDDVDYIMDTFNVVRQKDDAAHGVYRTKRLILERYDAMTDAIRTGVPYRTPLDPPPGQGPRHPAREGASR